MSRPAARRSNHALLLFPIVIVVGVSGGCFLPAPSDQSLKERFASNQEEFERIIELSEEDFEQTGVIVVAPRMTRLVDDWSWPRPESEWGISRNRWEEYRQLFEETGLKDGFSREGADYDVVLLPVYGYGIPSEGISKGYLWSLKEVKNSEEENLTFSATPIAPNWYIYESIMR